MFECSLYGTLEEISVLDEYLLYLRYKKTIRERKITIYKKDFLKIFLEGKYLTLKERPDTNKSRISICRKIKKQKIEGGIFEELGYAKSSVEIETIEYHYENNCFEISQEGSYFIVQLYTLTNSPSEGEKILEQIREALKDIVELKKPPVGWFLK